jgi:gluconate 2-dehydrogenase gamma chain
MSNESGFSRRKFLKATGIVAGAAALSTAIVPTISQGTEAHAAEPIKGAAQDFKGYIFFTNMLQIDTISQATERIFPKDPTYPGAIELGVPYFIDNQLAGAYGYNAREYMQPPFAKGSPTQGPQSALFRKDIFLEGINALNAQANVTFKANFPDITDAQKDQILKMCEAGSIPTEGFSSAEFFALLKTMTLAGVYADPIYNGNNNMNGWRMKDYPGAQMSYMNVITSKKFEKIAPVSLADMSH